MCNKGIISRWAKKYCSKECKHRSFQKIKIFICKQCGKENIGTGRQIRNNSKFCSRECSNQYRNDHIEKVSAMTSGDKNPMSYISVMKKYNCTAEEAKNIRVCGTKGFKFSVQSRKKMSEKKKNISLTPEHVENIRLANIKNQKWQGFDNPVYKNLKIGRGKCGFYVAKSGTRYWMKSSWERIFAAFLDFENLKWEYESTRFKLEDKTYIPDFYIKEWDLFVEVKGYLDDYSTWKLVQFRKLYPENHLLVATREILEKGYHLNLKNDPLASTSQQQSEGQHLVR